MDRNVNIQADWLECWLAEGNSIEKSEYYLEKQEEGVDAEEYEFDEWEGAAHACCGAHRCRVNSYITNRHHKRKVLRHFIITRIGDESFDVDHEWITAPIYLMCTRRLIARYGVSCGAYALDRMLCEEGRLLPKSVYIKRSNNKWYGTSPEFKRYAKRLSNRTIRRYRGELGRGRKAHRLTSREFINMLY